MHVNGKHGGVVGVEVKWGETYWTATLVGDQLEKTRMSIQQTSHYINQVHSKVRGDCNSTSSPDSDEDAEINAVAKACFGVPLLLDAYAGFLKEDRSKNAYKYALRSLQEGNFQRCSDIDLSRQVLYVYDKMDEEAKEAFLDICGKNKGKDTRLESIEELSKVLEKGREAITKVLGISLLSDKSPFNFKCKHLEEMHESLRVLALGDLTTLDGGCRKAFCNLRFLQVGSIDIFLFESISDFGKLTVIHNESIGGMRLPELTPSSAQADKTHAPKRS
eukprot:Gb_18278 [translate_table: standard]